MKIYRILILVLACVCLGAVNAAGAGPRVLPEGTVPDDSRLGPLKDLNGYFPFEPPKSREEWDRRSKEIRRRVLAALGLWPLPTRTPLNAVIHGRIDQDDYTVEKVYFESLPGFFVTGNLYRPKNVSGKCPGVLSPHGHWPDGRFVDFGEQRAKEQIAIGAERFLSGARSPLQARCVQLARMGCVVFHYDMIGYADSRQLSYELAHRFATQRPEMNTAENWGLFSPQAEAHLQSVMGLQAWNGIRSLDFLESLPEVDTKRLAVTGASGGATQTFILGAIDPRPAVIFPAVMVSTAMQGGCTCENASLLRVGIGNVDIAALFAPKPLGLTAAHDWTVEMESKGFPQLRELYALLGAKENVSLKPMLHFEHNYNAVSRTAMYNWFNQHLKLGFEPPVLERDFPRLSREQLTVWDEDHPAPEGGPEFERRLLRWLHEDFEKQFRQAQSSETRYRHLAGEAVKTIIGRTLESAGDVQWKVVREEDRGDYRETSGLLENRTYHEVLPIVLLEPKNSNDRALIWIDKEGKSGLFAATEDGGYQPIPEIASLLRDGVAVFGVDLLYQGEFLKDGESFTQTRRVNNEREAAAYTFGYNPSLFARRVHDILTVLAYLRTREESPRSIELAGLNGSGHWVAAAKAVVGDAVDRVAINTDGFRFGRILDLRDVDFLPGGAKYGDLPGMLALAPPDPLWIAGEDERSLAIVKSMYALNDAEGRISRPDNSSVWRENAIRWLIKE